MEKLVTRNRVIDYDATKMFKEDPDIDAAGGQSSDIDNDDNEVDEQELEDNPDWDDADDWEIIDGDDEDKDPSNQYEEGDEDNNDEDGDEDGSEQAGEDEEEFSNEENDSNKSSKNDPLDTDDNYDQDTEPELTRELLDKLKEALEEQEKFINGDEEKTKVEDDKNEAIDSMDDAGVEMETVGKECSVKGVNAIVIKRLTQSIIDADPFKVFKSGKKRQNIENIENGIRLGNMLGRKIQIRNEERTTKYTRLKNGRIDKRLVSSLGYGSEQIFSQTAVDVFNPVYLHISVDASGSMSGKKWNKTMIAVVAICKAASMVSNLDVSVDFRMTTDNNSGYNVPLVVIAYDSRKDKFEKVRRLFQYIGCPGITPEGLCFEAISKYIKEDKNTDQYFINFSDGAPFFTTSDGMRYEGSPAVEHTRKQVEKMREKGIKILSYFIKDDSDCTFGDFKRMYGRDAKDIDVNEIVPLAKTLNSMFAEK